LIAAQKQGDNLQLTTCDSFPLMDNGIPTGPMLWNAVPQDLKQKLQDGFGGQQQGGQQQGSQQGGQQNSNN